MYPKESKPKLDAGLGSRDDIRPWIEEALLRLGRSCAPAMPQVSIAPARNAPLERRIEHTLLKPGTEAEDIVRLCAEARRHRFRSVCVSPRHAALASQLVQSSSVMVVTVAGFPFGSTLPKVKAVEAAAAVRLGASEVDLVPCLDLVARGEARAVMDEVTEVAEACRVPVKVILETGLLDDRTLVIGALAAICGGGVCVKTSTGFGPRGASLEDVSLLRRAVGPRFAIKAAGGIRTRGFALELVAQGADLIGTSAGAEFVQDEFQ